MLLLALLVANCSGGAPGSPTALTNAPGELPDVPTIVSTGTALRVDLPVQVVAPGIGVIRRLAIHVPVAVRAGAPLGELAIDYELPPAGAP